MKDETNFLTKDEYNRFINSIPKMKMFQESDSQYILNPTRFHPKDLRLLFTVIYEGAFRISEVLKLTPNDLILNDQIIKLENTKGTKKAKKRQKREFGSIKKETFDALVEYAKILNRDDRIFPVSRQTVWRWAKEIGEIANIELQHENKDTNNMTIHTLRHSRAVHYVDAGQPINVIQKKLRHRSLQPTTTYLSINIDKIKDVEDGI